MLQGNGALRSTLVDMSKFLEAQLLVEGNIIIPSSQPMSTSLRQSSPNTHQQPPLTTAQEKIYMAMSALGSGGTGRTIEACTCVSDWCEGLLCPLPNPVQEVVTESGTTLYTSGLQVGTR